MRRFRRPLQIGLAQIVFGEKADRARHAAVVRTGFGVFQEMDVAHGRKMGRRRGACDLILAEFYAPRQARAAASAVFRACAKESRSRGPRKAPTCRPLPWLRRVRLRGMSAGSARSTLTQ